MAHDQLVDSCQKFGQTVASAAAEERVEEVDIWPLTRDPVQQEMR